MLVPAQSWRLAGQCPRWASEARRRSCALHPGASGHGDSEGWGRSWTRGGHRELLAPTASSSRPGRGTEAGWRPWPWWILEQPRWLCEKKKKSEVTWNDDVNAVSCKWMWPPYKPVLAVNWIEGGKGVLSRCDLACRKGLPK